MQPSAFYADEEKTYAGGFVYRVTTSGVNSLYSLNDQLDVSIAYTTPINAKYNQMNMGGWNNTSAATYVEKSLYFSKDYGSTGHSNVNQLNVRKDSFTQTGDTYICFAVNPSGYYYFGNAIDATETKGSLASKLLTDFEINKIVFRMGLLNGWDKSEFEYFQSNGSLQDNDGHDIAFADFIANPDDYVIRSFDVVALGYWDGSTWKANNLSNSPNIKPVFMTKNAMTWGYLALNQHLFNAASGTGSWGVSNVSVYNSTSGNTTNINAWSRGAVYSGLASAGYILGGVNEHLEHKPDMTYTTMMDKCDNGVTGADTTLPAKEFYLADSVLSYKYDQYTLSNDSGSSGPSHFSRYNYYFCCGIKGSALSTLLAHCGAYFYYGGSLTDLNNSGATPDNMAVEGMILGEMNAGGNTTGNWIGPDAMPDYVGPNKGGSIVHPEYNPTPPPPSGDEDDMDIMNTGATGSSGGFTHFYIMSPQDLIDLLSDFYTHADAGESLSNNLVCSYILGIPSSNWAATEDVPVAIHNSAQGTPFVSVDDYKHVTATNNMLVTGTFDVPRRTNTFYDFSPYTTYEVFIPCCGWVRLPDTVAGRTINVYLYLDIASCCVKGQVMISGAGVCAVVNGALGSPIPMAVIESGILRGNNIQAGMGMIGGAIQTGVSAGSGNAMGIGLGAERILTGLVNCSVAGNTNYTEQKGGTGDITQFAMGHQCYMKITHPVIDPVVNEYIFAHTVGYLCNTVGQLSDFHGFTMCSNPHIHISATSTEKEEIKRLLEEGVILP